jgi:hypothetical protein
MNSKPNPPEKDKERGLVRPMRPSGPVTGIRSDAIVAPATPSSMQTRSFVPRRRFQKGNIIIRGKMPTRYGMYREDVLQSDGTFKRVRRCVVLGPVSLLSERCARKMFQPYVPIQEDPLAGAMTSWIATSDVPNPIKSWPSSKRAAHHHHDRHRERRSLAS